MEVRRETRRSRTQDIRVKHRTMQLGWTKDGPTEVGGLVVKPGYRRLPVKIGKQLSLIRFVYMAMHPGRFKKRVLCEFLPNFSRQGHSLLWEHFGGKFTKMDYHIADHLSAVNKEFILGLFPHTKIYTTLMPPSVQEILEKTGDTSLPAQKMLEQIGFRYLKQICPFDGGPHFGAALKDVRVVRRTKFVKMRLEHARCDGPRKATRVKDVPQACGLVLADKKGTVRAVQAPWVVRNDQAHLSAEVCDALEVKNGDAVTVYKIA